MNTLFDLSGKVALVTGARTGLGQVIALALARAGADIAALGSRAMPETTDAIRRAARRFHAIEVDGAMRRTEGTACSEQAVLARCGNSR